MMRWILVIALVLWTATAEAGPQVLSWNPSAGATSHGIEQSVNNGATWTPAVITVAAACSGTPARCTATVNAPSTGIVLYRFLSINAVGSTTRFNAGVWICESCSPPGINVEVGVQ